MDTTQQFNDVLNSAAAHTQQLTRVADAVVTLTVLLGAIAVIYLVDRCVCWVRRK